MTVLRKDTEIFEIESSFSFERREVEEVECIPDIFAVFLEEEAFGDLAFEHPLVKRLSCRFPLVFKFFIDGNRIDERKDLIDIFFFGKTER